MNKITNRQTIRDTLLETFKTDRDIVVLCSDSGDSASTTPSAKTYPEQFVKVGIVEQNPVFISAGLAACGKKVFAVPPARFLLTRSYEQTRIDVAYSNTNVVLAGISGGVGHDALGMSHHSLQNIAAMRVLPDMRIYLSSDRSQMGELVEVLLQDEEPAYVRVCSLYAPPSPRDIIL